MINVIKEKGNNFKPNNMNKSIYKYPIQITDRQIIELPIGAEILTVQIQNQTPCIWAMVDPNENEKMSVKIEVFGTGHSINTDVERKYIGTFQQNNGVFVWHVFQQLN